MQTRPRTRRKKLLRQRRCPKCGKLLPTRAKRCKTCHFPSPKIK